MASRVLDEFIIKEVAKTCPESFLGFHKCMDDPTVTDKSECSKYQKDLQECIKTKVNVYHNIEAKCASVIHNYQDCLALDNEGNSSSKCYSQLTDLRACALAVISNNQKNA